MSLPPRQQAQFAIASQLLSDAAQSAEHPLAWTNLGYWQDAADYPQACAQLAQQLGTAAQLSASTALLDVGCGQGASIAYWQTAFAVQQIVALDIQHAQIDKLQKAYAQQPQIHCIQGAFDQATLPSAITAHSMHTVICLDAAYHARSMAAFLNFCAQALQDKGRLVFCTLIKSADFAALSWWQQQQHALLLSMAQIPRASVVSTSQLHAQLQAHGFDNVDIQDFSHEVLAGFAQYVQQRQHALSWKTRLSPAWQKIAITAQLCHFLSQHGAVQYVMVSARKHSTPHTQNHTQPSHTVSHSS